MLWILALVLAMIAVIILVSVLSFTLHVLFSPWLLLLIVGVVAWMAFRGRRRSHR